MAIAFDASVEAVRTGTTDPHTWTHTPVGTPGAIVVSAIHGTSATDHVLSVTYGGVSMTRIVRATDTVTEPGAAELWFLGAGIPTGAQTVSADLDSATTDDIQFVSMSWTAGADTEVVDFDSISQDAANPQVTLQFGGRSCVSVCALYGGGAAPTSYTSLSDQTRVQDNDFGAFSGCVDRLTTAQTADDTIGYASSTDDVAFVALAFGEVVPATYASTLRKGLTRLQSLGMSLVYKASPVRVSTPRLLSATLTATVATVALSGTVRAGPARAIGTATASGSGGTTASLASTARATPARLLSTGANLVYRASPVRAGARLTGQLTTTGGGSTATLAGTIRGTPARAEGALITQVALASVARTTEVRARGALTTQGQCAGTVRAATPRLDGALTTQVQAAGRVRASVPRLEGSLTMSGGTPVAVAGIVRAGPARVVSTGLQLGYHASPIRVGARLRGALSVSGGSGGTAALAGVVLAGPARLPSAVITIAESAAEILGPEARLWGQLTMAPGAVSLAGRIRGSEARAKGAALQTTVALRSTMRAVVGRALGSLTMAGGIPVPIGSTSRTTEARLTGHLTTVVALAGTARFGVPRLPGAALQVPGTYAGTVRISGARATGHLTSQVQFAGTSRGDLPRAKGQLLSRGPEQGWLTASIQITPAVTASIAITPAVEASIATTPAVIASVVIDQPNV